MRRSGTPTKGDLREQKILETLEELLAGKTFEALTINDLAEGAGLSRASLYFYFGSKQDALVALFAKTVEVLREKSRAAAEEPTASREAIAKVMARTRDQWLDHGLIMRVAIDQSAAVPELDALWTETADIFIDAITAVLINAGVPDNDQPDGARAMAQALCWMIERTFYRASAVSPDELRRASETCLEIWLRAAASGGGTSGSGG
ncbi:TetR/AcrR family transcriptional regulator [Kribbella sp. NBC_01505]|uniref:TetR/AcrR family transcriptional regulator n=1 Tax=Kribbella sp. NBC_01505 TaxID=2903580 RepID=UPI0038666B21